MRRLLATLLCSLLIGLVPLWPAGAADRPAVLRVGLASAQSADDLRLLWGPVLSALERRLGMPVRAEVAADYAGVIWKMRSGYAQVAWLGNKSAIEAVDNADAEVFAQVQFDVGPGGYHSLLLVNQESPLLETRDLFAQAAGLTFGIGDVNSTSGYLVPAYFLFGRNGVQPHRAFKRVVRGNHEDNLNAVAQGTVDAATVSSATMERVLNLHPELRGRFRVLWRSPLIPNNPILWRKDLPQPLKAEIKAFFLDYAQPRDDKPEDQLAAERAALRRLGMTGFGQSDNNQLVPVRQVELFRDREVIAADATLSAEQRARKLTDIDRRLAEIESLLSAARH